MKLLNEIMIEPKWLEKVQKYGKIEGRGSTLQAINEN